MNRKKSKQLSVFFTSYRVMGLYQFQLTLFNIELKNYGTTLA